MPKYLLPCECGKGIVIDASQAGQQIACECGELLEVPTLRGVRELESVSEAASASGRAADWDSSRGSVFAGSLVLFLVGAAVAFFGYDGLRAAPKITRADEAASFDKAVDDMSLEEVYETWKVAREHGLGARGQNIYVNIRKFRAGRQTALAVGIVLCVAALLGAIWSMIGQRKTTA